MPNHIARYTLCAQVQDNYPVAAVSSVGTSEEDRIRGTTDASGFRALQIGNCTRTQDFLKALLGDFTDVVTVLEFL